ncbi:MAG: hypothetical protein M3362_28455 [Acidobacteriota bacterium]|nr:hypothetical protein [Acidobacteriota bacterium]
MSKRLLGVIAVVWGAGILAFGLMNGGGTKGSGAYGAGQTAGLIFGVALLMAGIYNLAKSPNSTPK